jgi:predicted deacylase
MRVITSGDGEATIAVVVGIHGDEVCGPLALERFLEDDLPIERPVTFVVANEEALAANERYLDEDLNRAFPGSSDAETHEGRLAAEVLAKLEGCRVLDLHSTRSTPEPFGLYQRLTPGTRQVLQTAGLDRAVDISHVPGGLVGFVDGVAVECGLKGTEAAAENAERILRNFLAANGVIDADHVRADPTVFEVTETVSGADYEFLGENFVRVEDGEVFARRDDHELRATAAFYPVLMSTDGYDDIVGFSARRRGAVSKLDDSPAV